MKNALKTYLEQEESKDLDPELVQAHFRAMTEEVIPTIEEELREADQVAAELRRSPVTARGPHR